MSKDQYESLMNDVSDYKDKVCSKTCCEKCDKKLQMVNEPWCPLTQMEVSAAEYQLSQSLRIELIYQNT